MMSQHIEDVTAEEMARRAAAFFSQQGPKRPAAPATAYLPELVTPLTVSANTRSGRPGALVLSSRVPFRIRTFCAGLMPAETVSRIGDPSGNLHRAGYTGRS